MDVKLYKRSNYLDGVLLIADDLKHEQAYYVGRLNSLARRTGPGVIEGLQVETGKGGRGLVIKEGHAVDGYGQELLLAEEQPWSLNDKCWPKDADEMFLCLKFKRDSQEYLPALRPEVEAGEGASGDEHGVEVTYVEAAQLCLAAKAELPWPGWNRAKSMAEPNRGSPDLVALARLTRAPDNSLEFETLGRPVVTSNETLTRIIGLSWQHNSDFDPAKGLTLTFGAPLLELPPPAALRLTFEDPDGTLRSLSPSEGELAFVDGNPARLCWCLRDRCSLLPAGRLVRFNLACAFVLDEAGVPVSGAHLGGRLPSGDGIAGSDFESWFTVKRATNATDAREGPS